MRKRRIKIFVDGEVLVHAHFSGIGHYTADLLRAVDELLFEEDYSHVSVTIGVPFKLKHKIARFEFKNFGVRGMPFPIRVSTRLKQTRRLPPIDLLFGKKIYLFPNYSSWPTLFSKSVPIIYDLSFVNHKEFVEPRNQVFLEDQVKFSVKRADRIITISKHSKKEIAEHYGFDNALIDLVTPAVDIHKFYRRSESEILNTRAKYGIFENYILFVGNIEPRKNLITLLNAYENLPRQLQEKYSLLLVGAKGWLDNEINAKIINMRKAGLRVIQPTDYVTDDDLPALYSGAKVFVYVSRYEGFGIPPLESMACGTPVITSNNSSLPEVVGEAALTIDAMDDKKLTSSLEKLITDPELIKEMVERGYNQVTNFDWKDSAKSLIKVIEEVK